MKKLSIIAILVVLVGLMIPLSMAAADPNVWAGTVTDANGVTHDIGVTESGEVSTSSIEIGSCMRSCMSLDGPLGETQCEQAERCIVGCNPAVFIGVNRCGPTVRT